MFFFVSCFKVYFVWHKYCYSSFLFFSFPFAWNIFFHPFTFSLCVSFHPRWVFCRQYMWRSYFLIHSATICLLIGAFNPFRFKAIIDRYVVFAILLLFMFFYLYLLLLKEVPLTFLVKSGLFVINSFSFFLVWESINMF